MQFEQKQQRTQSRAQTSFPSFLLFKENPGMKAGRTLAGRAEVPTPGLLSPSRLIRVVSTENPIILATFATASTSR